MHHILEAAGTDRLSGTTLVLYHPTNSVYARHYQAYGIDEVPSDLKSAAFLTAIGILKRPYFSRRIRARLLAEVVRPLRRAPVNRFFGPDGIDQAISRALELAEFGTEMNRKVWRVLNDEDMHVEPPYPNAKPVLIECRFNAPPDNEGAADPSQETSSHRLYREMLWFALERGDWVAPSAIHRVLDPFDTATYLEEDQD